MTGLARRWLALAVGVIVSAVFCTSDCAACKLSEVWEGVRDARIGWLIPGVAVYFLAVWGRTWRWHYLLRSLQPISLRRLFPVVVIGYMGNNVYPFRAGEVIRAYVLRRNEGVDVPASLATIVVERIFDGLVMLLFVFVALPFADFRQDWLRDVVFLDDPVLGRVSRVFGDGAPPGADARDLYVGVRAPAAGKVGAAGIGWRIISCSAWKDLRSPRDLLMILVSSVFIWLTETTKYWFVMHAFDFEVSFFVLMVMTAVVNLATTLPSSPGYVGTFDTPGIRR